MLDVVGADAVEQWRFPPVPLTLQSVSQKSVRAEELKAVVVLPVIREALCTVQAIVKYGRPHSPLQTLGARIQRCRSAPTSYSTSLCLDAVCLSCPILQLLMSYSRVSCRLSQERRDPALSRGDYLERLAKDLKEYYGFLRELVDMFLLVSFAVVA